MSHKGVAILEKPVEKTPEKTTCRHHWIIEPALGPTSQGKCKLCGEEKTFLNVVEEAMPKSDLAKFFEPGGTEGDEKEDEGEA